jgi:hypothetical protein
MSLRLQINLLIAALISIFVAVVFAFGVFSTRSSVREQIQASDVVAAQLMANFVLDLYNIEQKLGANNHAALALIAVRNGLIEA